MSLTFLPSSHWPSTSTALAGEQTTIVHHPGSSDALVRTNMAPEDTAMSSGDNQHDVRKDSTMTTGDLGERLACLLHCLEDPHRNYNPANIDFALICEASIVHAQQVEALGTEYNTLEEAIHNLEQANNDRETRVRRLEEQANTSNDHEARLRLVEQRLREVLPAMGPTTEDNMAKHSQEVKSKLREFLNERPVFRGRRSAEMLAEFSMHEIVEGLLGRLRDGEKLSASHFLRLKDLLFPPALPPKRGRRRPAKTKAPESYTYHPSWMHYALEAGMRRRGGAVSDDDAEPAVDGKSPLVYDATWLQDTMAPGRRDKAEERLRAGKSAMKDSSPNDKDGLLLQQLGLERRRKVGRPRKKNPTTAKAQGRSTIRRTSRQEAESESDEEDDRTLAQLLFEGSENVEPTRKAGWPPAKKIKGPGIRQTQIMRKLQMARQRSWEMERPIDQQGETTTTQQIEKPKSQQIESPGIPQVEIPRTIHAKDAKQNEEKPEEEEADPELGKDNIRSGTEATSEEQDDRTYEEKYMDSIPTMPTRRTAAVLAGNKISAAAVRAGNEISARASRDRILRDASLSSSDENTIRVGCKSDVKHKCGRPSKRVSFDLSDTEIAVKLLGLVDSQRTSSSEDAQPDSFLSGPLVKKKGPAGPRKDSSEDAQPYSGFPTGPLIRKGGPADSRKVSSEDSQSYSVPMGPVVKKKGTASKIHGPVPSKRGLDGIDSGEARKRRKGRISSSGEASRIHDDDDNDEEDDVWIPEPDQRQEDQSDEDTEIANGRAEDDDPSSVETAKQGASSRLPQFFTPPNQISSPSFAGPQSQANSSIPRSKPFDPPSGTTSHNPAGSVLEGADDLLSQICSQLPAEQRPERPTAMTATHAETALDNHESTIHRQDSVLEGGDDILGHMGTSSPSQHPNPSILHPNSPVNNAAEDHRSPSIRSSARKRNRPALFGSPIHWKEANELVKGLRPSGT